MIIMEDLYLVINEINPEHGFTVIAEYSEFILNYGFFYTKVYKNNDTQKHYSKLTLNGTTKYYEGVIFTNDLTVWNSNKDFFQENTKFLVS